jgi:hypothetical protein
VDDFTIRGLDALLQKIGRLDGVLAASRARRLWGALCDLDERSGPTAFTGTYRWFYFTQRSWHFDPTFIRMLNDRAWVPDANNHLQRPATIAFETISPDWEPNARLLSKIRFKPPILETLAREAGIEPGLLELLKTLGVTTAAELQSRLGIQHTDEEADPDGLGHQKRLRLEAAAIELIIESEPMLQRTPLNNPGFDLVENDAAGKPSRWVEVKAMTGTLKGRPVGLSEFQFMMAQRYDDRYWLYIVENAGTREDARVIRIRNPAGKGSTFTFDQGWILAAETEAPDHG